MSGDKLKKVTVWDAATGGKLREMECGGFVNSVAFSADTLKLSLSQSLPSHPGRRRALAGERPRASGPRLGWTINKGVSKTAS